MTKQVALYRIPEILEVARILDDSVLNDYNYSIKSKYNSEKARETLGKFNKANGELTGSNPFMLVYLANSGFLPNGSRLAERKDLETATFLDNSFLSESYTDFGLALRTEGDSCHLLAKILAEQLKERGIALGKGKLISLNSLKLKEDRNSLYGLVFNLSENAEGITNLEDYKWDHSREDGLACAYFGSHRDCDSSDTHLAYSGNSGRVVCISAEGASQKILDEHLVNFQKARDEEITKIQERYAKAEVILK